MHCPYPFTRKTAPIHMVAHFECVERLLDWPLCCGTGEFQYKNSLIMVQDRYPGISDL